MVINRSSILHINSNLILKGWFLWVSENGLIDTTSLTIGTIIQNMMLKMDLVLMMLKETNCKQIDIEMRKIIFETMISLYSK